MQKKSSLLKSLDYTGACAGIIGATAIALNLDLNVYGYAIFMVASVLYTCFGYLTKNWGLLTMNIIFCFINLVGLVRHL